MPFFIIYCYTCTKYMYNMIPTNFNKLGILNLKELEQFQNYNNGQWKDINVKENKQVLMYPCRWKSNDINANNWGIRIVVYIQELNQTRPFDFTISYSNSWLIQPEKPSLPGNPVAYFLFHNGINII